MLLCYMHAYGILTTYYTHIITISYSPSDEPIYIIKKSSLGNPTKNIIVNWIMKIPHSK